jgi:hypothetical protein
MSKMLSYMGSSVKKYICSHLLVIVDVATQFLTHVFGKFSEKSKNSEKTLKIQKKKSSWTILRPKQYFYLCIGNFEYWRERQHKKKEETLRTFFSSPETSRSPWPKTI